MLKLEVGKRYWRRDGGVSGPIFRTEMDHPAFRFGDGLSKWYEDGVYLWGRQESEFDLIAEYIDPQPLEWKRGIPTEEECRECWILDGMCESVPCERGTGEVLRPGDTPHRVWLLGNRWYLALRIKPVEPPKPKTVTQRQYVSETREELWTQHDVANCWTPTGLTREVPA